MFRALVDAFKTKATPDTTVTPEAPAPITDSTERRVAAVDKLYDLIRENNAEGRATARGYYLAYAFLRGIPYRKVESFHHPEQKNEAYDSYPLSQIMSGLAYSGFLAPLDGLDTPRRYPANTGSKRYDVVEGLVKEWAKIEHPEFFMESRGGQLEAIRYWSKHQHKALLAYIKSHLDGRVLSTDPQDPFVIAVETAKTLTSCRGHLIKMGLLPQPEVKRR